MENRSILAETPRLILRRYEKGDLQDLFEYLSDAEVVKYEPHKPMTLAEAERSLDWRIGTDEMIAVEWKDSRKMIGNVFNRNYWGKGCASESCRALIQQAFSAGIHRIYAECDPLNVRSWKLLEAIGFRREAHLIQNVYFWKDESGRPIWKDTYVYAKLPFEE